MNPPYAACAVPYALKGRVGREVGIIKPLRWRLEWIEPGCLVQRWLASCGPENGKQGQGAIIRANFGLQSKPERRVHFLDSGFILP